MKAARYYWARVDREWSIVMLDTEANWVEVMGGDDVLDVDEVTEWGPEIERPAHLVDLPPLPSPPWIDPALLRAVAAAGYRALRPSGLPIILIPIDQANPNLVTCDTMEDLTEWLRQLDGNSPPEWKLEAKS